jgi:3-hydroxyacyl-[acyl-carrier-protein] dehydratase
MHVVSLIDRILSLEPMAGIRAVKNLSFREDYLRDHFPGFPLMPGALQLEAMIQAGQWLLRRSLDFPAADFPPVAIANSRYARYVRPGDQLVLDVSLVRATDRGWQFRGTGNVAGERTGQTQFELIRHDDVWTRGVSEETRVALLRQQRELFARLISVPQSMTAAAAGRTARAPAGPQGTAP